MWSKIFKASNHGLVRGVAIYSVTWPVSSLIQQALQPSGNKNIDLQRAAKFSVYGGLYVAPTLYAWMRFASYVWPSMTITSHITKAVVEQFSYGPFAMASFFFFMTLLDGGTIEDAKTEVQEKFVSTWKIAVMVWPVLQTINYCVIPSKNRLIFVSLAGFVWTTFLAYKKYEKNKSIQIADKKTDL
ncbi:mpv17-like protein [Acyrthosiphon pisum]|uniref:Mpv17-like protein n=1 Tax=Acyrthosiphon pisum TaxID=7029 RepID=A0A8R2AAT9_ACYPI|nr:mpv17-like protein [Acyrthosiphon pisum]|eukprot:XP_001949558.1 PREDICTED: mpv17-like protein [Acyrthosiphon pisum]